MFKIFNFENSPDIKNIAIRLSGGPDSAIIYYALCDFYKDSKINLFPYTMSSPLRPHAKRKAENIIKITGELTGKYPTYHFNRFHNEHNKDNIQEVNSIEYVRGQEILEELVYNSQPIDLSYTGLSKNCPVDLIKQSIEELAEKNNLNLDDCLLAIDERDSSRDIDFDYSDANSTVKMPFLRHDKRTVFEAYKYYGMLDKLYPHTWSCESDLQANHSDPAHCGTCYFCIERLFAFGRL